MSIRPATADDSQAIVAFWNPMIRDIHMTIGRAEKSDREVAVLPEAGRKFDRRLDQHLMQNFL